MTKSDDVAHVREIDLSASSISYVGLVSSIEPKPHDPVTYLENVERSLLPIPTADDDDSGVDDEDAEPSKKEVQKKSKEGENITDGVIIALFHDCQFIASSLSPGQSDMNCAKKQIKLPRSQDPTNEFESNGLTLMFLFRHICPLLRWENVYNPKLTEEIKVFEAALTKLADSVENMGERTDVKEGIAAWIAAFTTKGTSPSSIFDVERRLEEIVNTLSDPVVMVAFLDRWEQRANFRTKIKSFPLTANGTVSDGQTRHLLLQSSAKAAQCPPLVFVLANQKQRHAVLLASNRPSIKDEKLGDFQEIVCAPDFAQRLQRAKNDPTSPESKKLVKQLMRIMTLVGKDKPWSKCERRDVVPPMLAIKDRQSTPSVFYTAALDDSRSIFSIRLSFASESNLGFPSFSSEEEIADYIAKRTGAGVSNMMDALRNGVIPDLQSPGCTQTKHFPVNDAQFQRLAVDNPVATSMAFHRCVKMIQKVLFGISDESKTTRALVEWPEGTESLRATKRDKDGRPLCGVFGLTTGNLHVVETSTRKALHVHGLLYTAASPDFLALQAQNGALWTIIEEALQTQICTNLPWEVHVIHKSRQVLRVSPPRATFAATVCESCNPDTTQSQKLHLTSVQLRALNLQDHKHTDTCHLYKSGKEGCRGGYPKGHPVPNSSIVQLIGAHQQIPADATLAGDGGRPFFCNSASCNHNWPGINEDESNEEDNCMQNITLIKPMPQPSFTSSETFQVSRCYFYV